MHCGPVLGNFFLLGFQAFIQRLANFNDQEIEGHVADSLPVFQTIGHHNQVNDPLLVLAIFRALRQGNSIQRCGGHSGQVPAWGGWFTTFYSAAGEGASFAPTVAIGDRLGRISHLRRQECGIGMSLGGDFGCVRMFGDRFRRVGFVGHQHPVHQPHRHQFDVSFVGRPQHQLLESGEPQLFFVEAGDSAHKSLLQ